MRSISRGVVLRRPVGDDALDLLLVLAPRDVRREARVVGQLGTAHRVAQPAEDAVLVRGDHHPQVVARPEDVRRRDALQVRAHRLTDDAEPVVLRHGALEQRERRLHQRDVDDLPAPVAEHVAVVERRQDALDGEHRGERVAERDAGARRRLAREAVDVAEAAHRLRDGRVARALGVRPRLAVAGDAREDDAGVHLRQLARSRGSSARACRGGSSRRRRPRRGRARAGAPGPSARAGSA